MDDDLGKSTGHLWQTLTSVKVWKAFRLVTTRRKKRLE